MFTQPLKIYPVMDEAARFMVSETFQQPEEALLWNDRNKVAIAELSSLG